MKYSEFKRWLEQQGVAFKIGKGSHLHAELKGKKSILLFLMAAKKFRGRWSNRIKKDLGLK